MRPGDCERIEFEYIRHGTLSQIGSFDVVTGQSLSPTIGQKTQHSAGGLFSTVLVTVSGEAPAPRLGPIMLMDADA